jgi:hypothetical protein
VDFTLGRVRRVFQRKEKNLKVVWDQKRSADQRVWVGEQLVSSGQT